MGWYLRKSLGFGPLRINLSKSGLGGSVGVKGFRVGTGPRGRYLHAGRGGLYYRTSLEERGNPPEAASEPPAVEATEELGEPTTGASSGQTPQPAHAEGRNQLGVRILRRIFGGWTGR